MMNTLEAISKSSSHREYQDTPLTEDQLKVLLEAGLYAPSSENEQPWYLVGNNLTKIFKPFIKTQKHTSSTLLLLF